MRKRLKPTPSPEAAAEGGPRFMCIYRPPYSHTLMADVEKGDADAQFELGRLYFEGSADQTHDTYEGGKVVVASFTPGVPRHHVAAAELLQKAADQGHTEARQLLEVVKLHIKDGVH